MSKNILIWPAKGGGGGKSPLLPSPADAHALDSMRLTLFCQIVKNRKKLMSCFNLAYIITFG